MAVFGVFGLGLETAFTAGGKHLMGYSSLWYFPLYALAPLYFRLFGPALFQKPWWARGLAYMASLFFIEYLAMGALRLMLGTSPSEASYFLSPWNVHGLIRLDFAPAWFAAGLLFEGLYRFLPRP